MIRSASSCLGVDAAGSRGPLAILDLEVVGAEEPMQLADVADLGPARVGALDAQRIGDHVHDDLPDLIRLGEDRDGVAGGLAHLAGTIGPEHHGRIGEDGLRLREDLAVAAVEGAGDLARELQVRRLVLADRHPAGLVDDDVRRLQHGVVEQPHAVVDPFLALLLVGRGALQPADGHDRVEEPHQLGVLGEVGLADQSAALRVQADRQQVKHHVVRQLPQLRPVVDGGEGVHVDDAVDRVVLVLQAHVVDLSAEVIAQVRGARGLDA